MAYDMGLGGLGAAAGAGDAMQTLFEQRMQAAAAARADQAQQIQQQQFQQQMSQQDALTRLKYAELAEAARQRVETSRQVEKDRQAAQAGATMTRMNTQLSEIPSDQPISQPDVSQFTGAGIPGSRFSPVPINAPAPPPALAPAPGGPAGANPTAPLAGQPDAPSPVPGTVANSPAPKQVQFTRIPTPQEQQFQQSQKQKGDEQDWKNSIAQELADLKAGQNGQQKDHFTFLPTFENGQPNGVAVGNTSTGVLKPVQGAPVIRATPGGAQAGKDALNRQHALGAISRLDADIDEADKAGLLGPGAGRLYDALAKLGTTGDPAKDQIIGNIKGDLTLAKMHVDSGIGGARAAASPLLMKNWEDLALKSSKDLLKGYTGAMRKDMSDGATGAPTGGGKRIIYDMNGNAVK
jgi:hypothetical protein